MNLTTHAFVQLARGGVVTWTDEPTRMDANSNNPAWAVWESACGEYRIVFDGATDSFSPQMKRRSKIGAEWTSLCPDLLTLDGAQEVCRA